MITIEYVATPADVNALYSYCWKHSAYFRWRMISDGLLAGYMIILLSYSLHGAVDRGDIIIAFALAVLIPYVTPFIATLRTKKDKRSLSIDSKGIHTKIRSKRGDVPWSKIARLFTTEEHVFLLGRNLNGFCVPRKAFENASGREEFIRQCRDHCSETETLSKPDLRGLMPPARIIFIILIAFFVFYAVPIFAVVSMKWKVRNLPEVWVVPTPLPNVSIQRSGGLKFSYFGYEFESPWTPLKQERKLKSGVYLYFTNRAVVVFLDPSKKINELEGLKHGDAGQDIDVRSIFGDRATRSNYALRSKILYFTPNDLSLFSSPRRMVGNSILIMLKPLDAGRAKGGMYSFQTEWLRGFQDGDPAIDKMTIIDGFDPHDREVELWVGSQEGANKPSQADVNRILYSIRPAPESPLR
jgi:hypothetical protein